MIRSGTTLHPAEIDVVILAGGLGTRLEPSLKDLPKILAPIQRRPFLDYLMAWISQNGFTRVVLSLGHGADRVLQYLDSDPYPELDIVAKVEPSQMGTAGGIRFVRNEIRSDPALVMNGDSMVAVELEAFLFQHYHSNSIGSILCTQVPDGSRFGQIEVDETGRISRFSEKGSKISGDQLISTGIYLLSRELLDLIAEGTQRSLECDVFAALPSGTFSAMKGAFEFIDIGTPDSLIEAVDFFDLHYPHLL